MTPGPLMVGASGKSALNRVIGQVQRKWCIGDSRQFINDGNVW